MCTTPAVKHKTAAQEAKERSAARTIIRLVERTADDVLRIVSDRPQLSWDNSATAEDLRLYAEAVDRLALGLRDRFGVFATGSASRDFTS